MEGSQVVIDYFEEKYYKTYGEMQYKPFATVDRSGCVSVHADVLKDFEKNIQELFEIIHQMNRKCSCAAGNFLLSSIRSTKTRCICKSF